ncbi:ATP-binding cassette domain-containing protein [Bosea sp. PAMC 26642]|uniref:ATP-binding cassette domain-containing protein n=1 Tax=Bosea sp. (strain PAMC 26642) TaxID=1792307 RepID=UPI00202AB255|nr:ATP-binding cassette domain-containing protein [Bosea sp. PAMC 26642]
MAVKPGTIHSLIRPNGSGKSTMMNVLTGIYTPTGGEIAFEGQSLVGRNSPLDRCAGHRADLPERPALRRVDLPGKRYGRAAPQLSQWLLLGGARPAASPQGGARRARARRQ